jgi:DNA polymerase elongation subunit (family B)
MNGINPDKSVNPGRSKKGSLGELGGQNWQSSAYGKLDLKWFNMIGRISVDLYTLIKRDFKYPTFDLNTVARRLLNEQKEDLKAHTMFGYFRKILDSSRKIKKILTQDKDDINESDFYTYGSDETSKDFLGKYSPYTEITGEGEYVIAKRTSGEEIVNLMENKKDKKKVLDAFACNAYESTCTTYV